MQRAAEANHLTPLFYTFSQTVASGQGEKACTTGPFPEALLAMPLAVKWMRAARPAFSASPSSAFMRGARREASASIVSARFDTQAPPRRETHVVDTLYMVR